MGNDDNEHTVLLTQILDELREARRQRTEAGTRPRRRWYEREPFKNILSHGVVVCVAVVLGWFVHECTGAPVTIETAAKAPMVSPSAVAAAPPASVSVFEGTATIELVPTMASASAVAAAPPPTAAPARGAKAKRPAPAQAAPASPPPSMYDNDKE